MSARYGVFDAALYEERGGYPLPPPPPPPPPAPERQSYAAGIIMGIQITLVAIIVVTVFWVSDRNSTLPENVTTSDGRYAPCGVVTEQGITEHLDEYAARCGQPRLCSDQVVDARPLRTCVTFP